ncbi:ATP-binding cassette domain-containing protein [Candidatus Formimonas warabiya]|uniref:ABC transporter ATP-binding protein n=1 Tax=Formimonas warabiya TaxID=1761012 RepID=A0A3G1L0T4_FORW1|nr:ATP-binding cassette domain-containing protein [Candidatus Formimonas warabiya]ATW28239.1 ABC transporter ATP-binding protein [Candidatus Formimonas warabiya]
MIHVDSLKKSFGATEAVKGISFDVEKGEIFGLLGPNGAGKSTTIKILVTLLKSDGGDAAINHHDVQKEQNQVRKSVGIIFQDPSLDDRLTAWENLYFHSKLYHVPAKEIEGRIGASLELVGLSERKKDLVYTFSGGMKRRLEIARGIIHTPQVLFLDEPTIGLDPQTRKYIWQYLVSLRDKQDLTMLLTTHYMEEAEICDRVAIMDHGEIIALDTPENLKKSIQSDIITLVSDHQEELFELIEEKFGITPDRDGDFLKVPVPDGKTFLPHLFEAAGGRITSVDLKKPSLEDVFIKLTGRKIREEEASSTDRMRVSVRRRKKR